MTSNKSVASVARGWRYRVGLLLQRQAVAIEDVGHDLGDVVEAGGKGRGVGPVKERQRGHFRSQWRGNGWQRMPQNCNGAGRLLCALAARRKNGARTIGFEKPCRCIGARFVQCRVSGTQTKADGR